eukprot:TRINITY_DN32253_c3_g1_i1.p1 TRINITY_DN32253_c3_g1~~TRINITY_DN32253_c3_g1_i1.p1  ORF type:complete len:291 (+),score=126.07 TRINITY_DN32253_c3_g1_i1:99-971(+)
MSQAVPKRSFPVAGKISIVTGGGSGIGAALCETLCKRQAKVVIVADINMANARGVAEKLNATYGATTTVEAMPCNVGKEKDIRNLILACKMKYGAVELFVANAGITGGYGGPEVTNDEWDEAFKINTMHIIWAARHALPDMVQKKSGGFIITSSAAGLITQVGLLPYAVTKASAVTVADWLALTHYNDNIHVTCLCPQAVDTPMIAASKGGGAAGVDGILSPSHVADFTLKCYESGTHWALPHKTVNGYLKAKVMAHDQWIQGMARFNRMTDGGRQAPQFSPEAKKKAKL